MVSLVRLRKNEYDLYFNGEHIGWIWKDSYGWSMESFVTGNSWSHNDSLSHCCTGILSEVYMRTHMELQAI